MKCGGGGAFRINPPHMATYSEAGKCKTQVWLKTAAAETEAPPSDVKYS